MQTIGIENVGAIASVEIPLPEEGGFVVLKGTHGVGKSTALRATESLASGNGTIEKRDGTLEGRVSGFGASLTVKKVVRRSGRAEIAVESLAGRLSLADIVDPHIKDPLAADAYRIKSLLSIAGVKPSPADFHRPIVHLVGPDVEFDRIVGNIDGLEAVVMAARVKRSIEKAAREIESSSDRTAGEAAAFRQEAAGCDGIELRDPVELQADLEDAIRREAKLKSGLAAFERDMEGRRLTKEKLDAARAAYTGPEDDVAAAELERASNDVAAQSRKVAQLHRQLEEAQMLKAEYERAEERAELAAEKARAHFGNLKTWQSIINARTIEAPTAEELAGAAEVIAIGRREIETQAIARKAKAAEQSAITAEAKSAEYAERAAKLREAAAKTDDVLSGMVAKLDCPLRVKNDRLVLDTDRGEELFADLSDGERYAIAFDLAIPRLPPNGLLTLSQAAYGELAPATRRDLNAKLKARGVCCLTAEATDDEELHAEVFDG